MFSLLLLPLLLLLLPATPNAFDPQEPVMTTTRTVTLWCEIVNSTWFVFTEDGVSYTVYDDRQEMRDDSGMATQTWRTRTSLLSNEPVDGPHLDLTKKEMVVRTAVDRPTYWRCRTPPETANPRETQIWNLLIAFCAVASACLMPMGQPLVDYAFIYYYSVRVWLLQRSAS